MKSKQLKWIRHAAFLLMFLGVMGTMMCFLNGTWIWMIAGIVLIIAGVLLLRYVMNQ